MLLTVFVGLMSGLFAQQNLNEHQVLVINQKEEIINEATNTWNVFLEIKDEYLLDSIVYYQYPGVNDSVRNKKMEYIFGDNEDYQRITSVWNASLGQWINDERWDYIFDVDGNLIEYQRNYWDEATEAWIPTKKFVMTYNTAGLEILFIYQNWDEILEDWKNFFKSEYVYNDESEILESWDWEWDEISGTWAGLYHSEWEYTGSGLMEIRIDYGWDVENGEWTLEYKTEYIYDSNDFLIETNGSNMGPISGQWSLNHKSEYTNNTLGYPTLIINSYSQDDGITWAMQNKREISYLNDHLQILNIGSVWNGISQNWEYSEKHEFEWDAWENQILDSRSYWDESLNDWTVYNMVVRVYDENGKLLEYADYGFDLIWQQFIGIFKSIRVLDENGNYAVNSEYSWDLGINDWKLDQKGYYYFSFFTGIPKKDKMSIHVFPNPVTSQLHIRHTFKKATSFRIYTMQGSLVQKGLINGSGAEIDVSGFQAGSYLLHIDNGRNVYKQMFIKN